MSMNVQDIKRTRRLKFFVVHTMDIPTVIGVASDGLLYHVISDASFKVPSGQRAGASGELG